MAHRMNSSCIDNRGQSAAVVRTQLAMNCSHHHPHNIPINGNAVLQRQQQEVAETDLQSSAQVYPRLAGIDLASKNDSTQSPTSQQRAAAKALGRSATTGLVWTVPQHRAMHTIDPTLRHAAYGRTQVQPLQIVGPTLLTAVRCTSHIGPWHLVALMNPSSASCRGLARYQQHLGPRCLPASTRASKTGTHLLLSWFETRRNSRRHVQAGPLGHIVDESAVTANTDQTVTVSSDFDAAGMCA
jgi:hypothetical protein